MRLPKYKLMKVYLFVKLCSVTVVIGNLKGRKKKIPFTFPDWHDFNTSLDFRRTSWSNFFLCSLFRYKMGNQIYTPGPYTGLFATPPRSTFSQHFEKLFRKHTHMQKPTLQSVTTRHGPTHEATLKASYFSDCCERNMNRSNKLFLETPKVLVQFKDLKPLRLSKYAVYKTMTDVKNDVVKGLTLFFISTASQCD